MRTLPPQGQIVVLGMMAMLPSCRDQPAPTPAPDPLSGPTRFDDLEPPPPPDPPEQEPPPRALPPDPLGAREIARRTVDLALDDIGTLAHATFLTKNPTTLAEAEKLGRTIGTAEVEGGEIVLRFRGAKAAVFARLPATMEMPARVTCWQERWRPSWTPEVPGAPGHHVEADARVRWWRFETPDAPDVLVRFDPDGVAIWRHDPEIECYRGDSLLGIVHGAAPIVDLASPGPWTDPEDPVASGIATSTEPATIDLGDRQVTLLVKPETVSLVGPDGANIRVWEVDEKTEKPGCSDASWSLFEPDDQIQINVEFTNSEWCDDTWTRRETHDTLIRMTTAAPRFELSEFERGEGYAGERHGRIEIVIPIGDGMLHFDATSESDYDETGGERWYDCGAWGNDHRVPDPVTGYQSSAIDGRWTWRSGETTRRIGKVHARSRNLFCTAAP